MRSTVEERFILFALRRRKVRWKRLGATLEDVVLRLPAAWRRVETLAQQFMKDWGEANPFDDSWAFPHLIRRGVNYWWAIGTPPSLLSKVLAGEVSRHTVPPKRALYCNDVSCHKHAKFIDDEVQRLLKLGVLLPIPPERAQVVLPIKVVEGRKLRLVINGIPLNCCIPKLTFTVPSIDTLAGLISHNGMKAIYFDSADAFYQGSVCPDDALHQCIRWKHPVSGEWTTFAVLSRIFGHRLNPVRYTRLHNFPFEFATRLGIPNAVYIDDGFVLSLGHPSYVELVSAFTLRLVNALWVAIRREKSDFEGTSRFSWIGFDIDLERLTVALQPRHAVKIRRGIADVLASDSTSLRALAKLRGLILSKKPAIEYASILCSSTRACLRRQLGSLWNDAVRLSKFSQMYDTVVPLTQDIADDMKLLDEIVVIHKPMPIFHYAWDLDIYVDSSDTHTGAHSTLGVFHLPLPPELIYESSSARELWGVFAAMCAHGTSIAGKKVRFICDNLAVATITGRNASGIPLLRWLHKGIAMYARRHDITFWVRWRRRSHEGIKLADALSRAIDKDEWLVDSELLSSFTAFFELPDFTLDAFASGQNSVAPQFFSRAWEPSSVGVDFFDQRSFDFADHFVWLNPPFQQRVLAAVVDCIIAWDIEGVLCLPNWLRSNIRPLLHRFASHVVLVSRSCPLYTPSLAWKVHKRRVSNPRFDSILCVFTRNKCETKFWRTHNMRSFKPFDFDFLE